MRFLFALVALAAGQTDVRDGCIVAEPGFPECERMTLFLDDAAAVSAGQVQVQDQLASLPGLLWMYQPECARALNGFFCAVSGAACAYGKLLQVPCRSECESTRVACEGMMPFFPGEAQERLRCSRYPAGVWPACSVGTTPNIGDAPLPPPPPEPPLPQPNPEPYTPRPPPHPPSPPPLPLPPPPPPPLPPPLCHAVGHGHYTSHFVEDPCGFCDGADFSMLELDACGVCNGVQGTLMEASPCECGEGEYDACGTCGGGAATCPRERFDEDSLAYATLFACFGVFALFLLAALALHVGTAPNACSAPPSSARELRSFQQLRTSSAASTPTGSEGAATVAVMPADVIAGLDSHKRRSRAAKHARAPPHTTSLLCSLPEHFAHLQKSAFGSLGRLAARRPWLVVYSSGLLALGCSCGLLWLVPVQDPLALWLPDTSVSSVNAARARMIGQLSHGRSLSVLIEGRPVGEGESLPLRTYLDQALLLHEAISATGAVYI